MHYSLKTMQGEFFFIYIIFLCTNDLCSMVSNSGRTRGSLCHLPSKPCTGIAHPWGSPAEKRLNSPAFANLMPQIFFWERSGQSWPSFGGCTRGGFLFPSFAAAARAGEGRPAQATSPEDNELLLEGQAGVLAC